MIKYKATNSYRPKITPVEVERETDSSVWINGRRNSKETSYENYFDSWDKAQSHLIRLAQKKVASANLTVERAKEDWRICCDMKKPEES